MTMHRAKVGKVRFFGPNVRVVTRKSGCFGVELRGLEMDWHLENVFDYLANARKSALEWQRLDARGVQI
jgi:hypothetical protein